MVAISAASMKSSESGYCIRSKDGSKCSPQLTHFQYQRRRPPINPVEAFGILLFFGAVGLLFCQRWGRTLCRTFYLSVGVVGGFFALLGVSGHVGSVLLGALLVAMSTLAVKFLNRESVRCVLGCRVPEENPPETVGRFFRESAYYLLGLVAIYGLLAMFSYPFW